MTESELRLFGCICADSFSYESLSENMSLNKNSLSDIKDLINAGRAVVGKVKGHRHSIVVRYFKLDDGSVILKASAMGINTLIRSVSDDAETLAWAYIDILTNLKVQINLHTLLYINAVRKIEVSGNHTPESIIKF